MTTAQILYLVAFCVYLIFFLLFARFFVWKKYSERKYWGRKCVIRPDDLRETAQRLGKTLPFISILVPARNEALVIENTIRHLTALDYPTQAFEIVVVTDEKEALTAKEERRKVAACSLGLLRGHGVSEGMDTGILSQVKAVSLACLADFALGEYLSKGFQKTYSAGGLEMRSIPASERLAIVRGLCEAISGAKGAPREASLKAIVKRVCPWQSRLDRDRVYPAFLAVAAPVLSVYSDLWGGASRRAIDQATRHALRASHHITRDVLRQMTDFIARRVSLAVKKADATGALSAKIGFLSESLYPTTQEVVERTKSEERDRGNEAVVKHCSVPWDFDGKLGGVRLGHVTPSTKGRALNWAVQFLDSRTDVCGFYDAESRPDPDVLLYVGYKRLLDPHHSRVLQGPVFQVRNFYQMTPFCRIASLYQALAHDWYLPWLFRTLPFVGGTNVYVERRLLWDVGGWDCEVLTEDLEFGARAYLSCGAWPGYLPYPSSEQTPATFKAFFKQRLRWGTGHLQVVDKVRKDYGTEDQKVRHLRRALIVKGQVEWVVYQLATFVPPLAMVLHYKNMLDPSVIPVTYQWMLQGFSLTYLSFTIYAFKRYSGFLDHTLRPEGLFGRTLVYLGLLLLPLAAFVFPVPYTSALVLKTIGREPRAWVKTPRSEEGRAAG